MRYPGSESGTRRVVVVASPEGPECVITSPLATSAAKEVLAATATLTEAAASAATQSATASEAAVVASLAAKKMRRTAPGGRLEVQSTVEVSWLIYTMHQRLGLFQQVDDASRDR